MKSNLLFTGQELRVAIVGAGLIGCGVAYELAKRGCAVTVYDRAEPARAASWAGAGMLAPYSEATDDDAMLALCREGLAVYPAFVEELRERVGVDAHFVRAGALHVALDASRLFELAARAMHIARPARRSESLIAPRRWRAKPSSLETSSAHSSSKTRRRLTTVASGARSSRRARRSAFTSSASTISRSRPMLDASADCELHAALSMPRLS